MMSLENVKQSKMEQKSLRVNKLLSEMGYCSRREGDKLLEAGRIEINGVKAGLGDKASHGDEIKVDGKVIQSDYEQHVYILLNKPRGIVSTTDTKAEKNNIIDYINYPKRIFPIGRLDKLSEGLILLTSDGDIVNSILREENNHEKEYIVTVNKPITKEFIKKMGNGVPILGQVTKKCHVEKLGKFEFRIILTQGLNRQIRRMCDYFDYKVVKLKRVRIMDIKLDIPTGEWRYLTKQELQQLS